MQAAAAAGPARRRAACVVRASDQPRESQVSVTDVVDRDTAALRRLDTLGYLLDNSIPIPGTGMRVGLDAVIGLVPAAGDAAGALLSCWIVLQAARLGVGFRVIGRMLLILAVDTLVGSIPLLGDLFDAWYKANERNLRLIHSALRDPAAARRKSGVVLAVVALLLLALVFAGLWLAWKLIVLLSHPTTIGGL
jgi:hypothetical protein